MKHFRSVMFATLAILMGVLAIIPADAVSAVSSSSLSIAPKKEYEINAGKSVHDTINISVAKVNDS